MKLIITVPVTEEQKAWLADRAKDNMRAVGREVQAILEAERARESRKRRA